MVEENEVAEYSDEEILNDEGEVVQGAISPEGEMDEPDTDRPRGVAPMTREAILQRAQSWIDEQVPYSQSLFHTNTFGKYRQDCSGFTSMCWQLGQSFNTETITQKAQRIGPHSALEPGDALWFRSGGAGHIAVFVRWADAARTKPVMREERKTGTVCLERTWTAEWASKFAAIRVNGVQEGGGPAPEPVVEQLPVFRTRTAGVRVRKEPNTTSAIVTKLAAPTAVAVKCQAQGESVTIDGVTRTGWAFVPALGGFISLVLIEGSPESLPGVPPC